MGVTGNQGNQRDASVGSSGKRGAYQFAFAQGAREGTVIVFLENLSSYPFTFIALTEDFGEFTAF